MAVEFDSRQIPHVTWKSISDLIEKGGSDCLALWLSYARHANIQKTNNVWAKLSFISKSLSWGRDKTQKIRKKLIEFGYLELLQRHKKANGTWEKQYTKVNHLVSDLKLQNVFNHPTENQYSGHPTENTASGETSRIKCLYDDNTKYLKDDNFAKKENNPTSIEQTQWEKGLKIPADNLPHIDPYLSAKELLKTEELERVKSLLLDSGIIAKENDFTREIERCVDNYEGKFTKGMLLSWLKKPANYQKTTTSGGKLWIVEDDEDTGRVRNI